MSDREASVYWAGKCSGCGFHGWQGCNRDENYFDSKAGIGSW